MILTHMVSTLCFTSTDNRESVHDYMLSGCPVPMGPAFDEDGHANPAYLNMTAGAW